MVISRVRPLRIASRGSPLALWQANAVRDALLKHDPDLPVEIDVVRTTGDRITDAPLSQIGERGVFTKEVDSAVLEQRADIAVHSLKDLPTRIADDLALVAITKREDPRDVLLTRKDLSVNLDELPAGALVGTSSLRRRAQLLARRPDLRVADLRGNLNTRLAKLDAGEYDAIVLAAAGVIRLEMADRISQWLDPEWWLPAVGQGALGIVARADDAQVAERLSMLHDVASGSAAAAERALLRDLEGGCQIPVGALAIADAGGLSLTGMVASLDGRQVLRHTARSADITPEALGLQVAAGLRDLGAEAILGEIRRQSGPAPAAP